MNDRTDGPRRADRLYDRVKAMAVTFHFKPGERVHEGELAARLGTSRTPLREALNRLASEGLLVAVPNHGFFARQFDVAYVQALYEYRLFLETNAIRLACLRATDEELSALSRFARSGIGPVEDDSHAVRQLRFDEAFHERIAALSHNPEILRSVRSMADRIRFIRWIGLRKGSQSGMSDGHQALLDCLERRDADCAAKTMHDHLIERIAHIAELVREGHAEIHTSNKLAEAYLAA